MATGGFGMKLMNGAIQRRTAVKFVAAATAALGASSVPLLARAARFGPPELVEPGAGAWRTLTYGRRLRRTAWASFRKPAPRSMASMQRCSIGLRFGTQARRRTA